MKIVYVTGNKSKFKNAQEFLSKHNIDIEQTPLDIREIQSGDSVDIAIAKAEDAFSMLQRPLFVNDATWIIPALGGFPGPFMKYINQWFQPIDFVNLMQGKTDRRIILKDIIVYIDETGHKVFTNEHTGLILDEPADMEYRHPSDVVVSLSQNQASIAEEIAKGGLFIENEEKVWEDFVMWIKKEIR